MAEVAVVLIGAAVLAFLAAVVGGGVKAGGIEITQRLNRNQRVSVSALGVVFAVAGGLLLFADARSAKVPGDNRT